MSEEKIEVGKITHYYPKISVAVVELTSSLQTGDKILIKGKITNIEQFVESMQIERVNIQKAEAGQSIGLKVNGRVKEGDIVYKII